MPPLPASLLQQACESYLRLAYPNGDVPVSRQPFLHLKSGDCVDPLLCPPVCEKLTTTAAGTTDLEGFAFRLGSHVFPHVKLQVLWHPESQAWVVGVDTHDAIRVPLPPEDVERFRELQARNRQLKAEIERAWEANGLLTFNGLLRQGLNP